MDARSWRRRAVQFPAVAKCAVAANAPEFLGVPRTPKKALSMRYYGTSAPKAIDGAISACLAECAQIADPEAAGFGQLSPTRLSKAQQAKIPHGKSKGLRAGSSPSKRELIIRGMFAAPVFGSEDSKEGTMIYIRHLDAAPEDTKKDFAAAQIRTHALTLATEGLREGQVDLAHVNRITTIGRLTASIAPEVTQPIAAIVTNAQAARHFLDRRPPDMDEVREALDCIVREAYRASDVIYRIRGLLKEAPPKKERAQINGAIRDVLELTRGQAAKNGVSVRTQFAEPSPVVQADRVQVQQVILNLIINAVEAMSSMREGARELLICTEKAESNSALVAIRDSGPGLDLETVDRLFEAFYTTKVQGMGIGLAICRSIIQAHGGRLWARANVPCGAIFQFTLPITGPSNRDGC
jgi:C4-dicarboxylate-specific signal transduction histidine kinase